jgi:hypothetical protein
MVSCNIVSKWARVTHGILQGSLLGPLLFLLYIIDLPKNTEDISVPVLHADDTNILLSHSNFIDFTNNISTVSKILNAWFTADLLYLNFSKTHFTYFTIKLNKFIKPKIGYDNNVIPATSYMKFLGVTTDHTLSWPNHTELLIMKLNSLSYLIRMSNPICPCLF